jgi:hypothetical protein
MLVGIIGSLGSGKTTTLIYIACRKSKHGIPIYANFHLRGIHYKYVESPSTLRDISRGVFLGDELWIWADCRLSLTELNRFIGDIAIMSRKRGLDIYYTAQMRGLLDIRIRGVTDVYIYPEYNREHDIIRLRAYKVTDFGEQFLFNDFFKASDYFKYFSTKEIVERPERISAYYKRDYKAIINALKRDPEFKRLRQKLAKYYHIRLKYGVTREESRYILDLLERP